MAIPRSMLNDHEELVLDLRPHWVFLVPSAAAAVGGVLLGLLILLGLDWGGTFGAVVNVLAALLILATLGWFGWKYATWSTTSFALTSDRIVTHQGIFAKRGVDIPLDRVNTVIMNQSFIERLVGAGNLQVQSAGEKPTTFSDIQKPAVVQREIHLQKDRAENRRYDYQRDGSGPTGGTSSDPTAVQGSIPEQIEQLSALHQRGVISDAEFQAKKAELLDRM